VIFPDPNPEYVELAPDFLRVPLEGIYKNLVFRVCWLRPHFCLSYHHQPSSARINHDKKDVKNSFGARVISAKPLLSLKAPEISQPSPPGQKEDHEKY